MNRNEEAAMMLESIRVMEPDCARSEEQLRALIAHCQKCRNHEVGNGCVKQTGGDLWGYWRDKLVSGFCNNWPEGALA